MMKKINKSWFNCIIDHKQLPSLQVVVDQFWKTKNYMEVFNGTTIY